MEGLAYIARLANIANADAAAASAVEQTPEQTPERSPSYEINRESNAFWQCRQSA
jgi:hypothetical protein